TCVIARTRVARDVASCFSAPMATALAPHSLTASAVAALAALKTVTPAIHRANALLRGLLGMFNPLCLSVPNADHGSRLGDGLEEFLTTTFGFHSFSIWGRIACAAEGRAMRWVFDDCILDVERRELQR